MLKRHAKAFILGLTDGWAQPIELSTSTNVDHLASDYADSVYNTLDRGINIGQFAHAGFKSQSWAEGFWPFDKFKK